MRQPNTKLTALQHCRNNEYFGLTCWHGQPIMMQQAHRHGEVELNLVTRGVITYLHRDRYITVPAGQLAAFWAAVPHQLVERPDDTEFYYVTLPIETLLSWKLPTDFTHALLAGELMMEQGSGNSTSNAEMFARWYADLSNNRAFLVLMEIEARLWRLALATQQPSPHASTTPCSTPSLTFPAPVHNVQPTRMAQYIIQNYSEPITVQAIADHVSLHPNYALTTFKRVYGLSLLEFVTQYRIAQAQRLLLTTEQTVLSIALQCGFESSSNFYAAFQKHVGRSPRTYRLMTR